VDGFQVTFTGLFQRRDWELGKGILEAEQVAFGQVFNVA
jgi:hypothetical protein